MRRGLELPLLWPLMGGHLWECSGGATAVSGLVSFQVEQGSDTDEERKL